jgi:sec1 family domain-containing protein 1
MQQAASGRPARPPGPSREAIVFMIGGGSYLERESLATWAGRAAPPKSVVYGATELLTGEAFAAQLAELGRRSGAA